MYAWEGGLGGGGGGHVHLTTCRLSLSLGKITWALLIPAHCLYRVCCDIAIARWKCRCAWGRSANQDDAVGTPCKRASSDHPPQLAAKAESASLAWSSEVHAQPHHQARHSSTSCKVHDVEAFPSHFRQSLALVSHVFLPLTDVPPAMLHPAGSLLDSANTTNHGSRRAVS